MQAILIKSDGAVKFTEVPYRSTRNYGGPEPVLQFPVRIKPALTWEQPPLDTTTNVEVEIERYELIGFTRHTRIAIYEQTI